jgi:hypothetical protein
MSTRIALSLLLCFPTLVSAAVSFGPERPLVAPRNSTAAGTQLGASVASSGAETLVAWIDGTVGRQGVYLAALDETGTPVPGSQRRLASGAISAVTLSWTGRSYLALWSSFVTNGGITATTLDGERRTLTPPHVVIPAGNVASTVEWAGERGMFVYVLDDATYRAALIDRGGVVVRAGITFPEASISTARVFSDGQSFLAIWQNMPKMGTAGTFVSELFAARYTAEGEMSAAPAKVATLGLFSGGWEAAFDGSRFALAVAETGQGTAVLRRIIIDPATLTATTLPPVDMGPTTGVRLEWNGSRFVAFWTRSDQTATTYTLQTLSFSADGSGDTEPQTASAREGAAYQPSGAWNGEALVVAWAASAPETPGTNIYTAALTGGAELSVSPFPIAIAPTWQSRPAVAGDGNQSLIVWMEGLQPADRAPLVAAHATAGRVDTAPLYLSDIAVGPAQVVFTGAAYLVFWLDAVTGNVPRLVMQRIDVAGSVVDAQETFIANAFDFGVAFNGTHALVAYRTGTVVEAVRFEADGTVVDTTPLPIPAAGVSQMASNGSEFAFVWREIGDVYAAVIDAQGLPVNARIAVGTGDAFQHSPAIATDGRDFMIAYVDGPQLLAKKLLREGALGGSTVIDTALREGFFSFIASSDEGYLAGWEVHEGTEGAAALRVAGLDANGTVTGSARTVAFSELSGMHGALATGGGATGDLVYARLDHDETYGAGMRLFVRRLGEIGGGRGRAVRH